MNSAGMGNGREEQDEQIGPRKGDRIDGGSPVSFVCSFCLFVLSFN